MLNKKYFNDDGSVWHEIETIEIDSNLKANKIPSKPVHDSVLMNIMEIACKVLAEWIKI